MDVHLQDMTATYGNIVLLSLIEQVWIPLDNARQYIRQEVIVVY